MNVWFGESWGAPVCCELPHVDTPVGEPCFHCGELFSSADSGYGAPHIDEATVTLKYYHLECWMRGVIGSVAHQMRLCSCYGGHGEDSPHLTKHEAAIAAWQYWQEQELLNRRFKRTVDAEPRRS